MADKIDILKRIKESVNKTAPCATVILYGSYARGDNKIDSDIDVIVLIDNETIAYDDEKKIKYPLYHIDYETGTMISPLVLSKNVWETKHRITHFIGM